MAKYIKVNGKSYLARDIDFNFICDLEGHGISLNTMDKQYMSAIRAYVAHCAYIDIETAGAELEKHIVNGGNFEDLYKAMSEKMEESDFFRSLTKAAEAETGAVEEEAQTEVKKPTAAKRSTASRKE